MVCNMITEQGFPFFKGSNPELAHKEGVCFMQVSLLLQHNGGCKLHRVSYTV